MDKLFLLDAYALIYRAYYALIKNPRINSKGFNTSAVLGFVNTLEDVLKKESPTHIGVAFDPSGPTFRHEVYEQYKAQREETPEVIRASIPIIKAIIRAYRIPILEVSGYEADDVIGTLATQAGKQGITTYMMTPDKDYGQLVSEHVFMYRPKYGDKEFDVMGPEEVKAKFNIESPLQVIDMLGLMGDSSDNIPGCPGVGEKTAQKLIAQFGSIENLLSHTDELKGALKTKVENNREMITFSKFLATIKTDVPIELNLAELKRETPDEDALRKIFEEMEFRTLIERVLGKEKKLQPSETVVASQGNGQLSLFGELPPASPKKNEIQGNLFAEFADEGTTTGLFSNLTSLESLDYDYQLIDTEEKRIDFLQIIKTKEFFSLDTETTDIDPINAELVGMSFSYAENQAFYVPIPAEREEALKIVNEFKELLENEQTVKVGQNIKYDMLVLSNYGVEVKGPLFDTMIAHYVLQPELRHNMDYLAEIYLNYQTIHIEELIGQKGKNQGNMRNLSPQQIYKYACEDADVTLKLKNRLEQELKEQGAEKLFYEIEMPLVPVLAYMEKNGVRIDTHALKETSTHFTARMIQIENEIYQLAGTEFNVSSPKQVGEILFERLKITDKAKKTKTGQYVTSEEVLEGLRNKHDIVGKILDYRGLKKLLGTYIDALPLLINERTGKIHTSFNQTVTATGRLSSSNPNLQNIPIRN
ncbi:MAG: DNA polymerase I, partial [Bacteroides sp.]|nr:DNA polymerase I [Bacteroides sp.]